ncbi:MAG: agmatinase [Chloroflexota bacterium]
MHRPNSNPAYGADLAAFGGIPTFMRQPASRDLAEIDVAIVGIPFDSGATSNRSGTRLGPRKIREQSLLLWGYNRVLKVGPLDILNVVDYGDVDVEPINILTTFEAIKQEVGSVIDHNTTVIALGGDHSISYPLLEAHATVYGPPAVIHFDAHTDTESWEHPNHGTPFADAIKAGAIDTEAYIQVGIRGPLYAADEIEQAEALGAQVLTIDDCFDMGIPAVIERIRAVVGQRQVYVSLDIDSLDPAYAPGTGTPEVGGFTSYQMLRMVRALKGLNIIGFDLVEVSPPYDSRGEITAILAANLAFEFLALLALQKQLKSI